MAVKGKEDWEWKKELDEIRKKKGQERGEREWNSDKQSKRKIEREIESGEILRLGKKKRAERGQIWVTAATNTIRVKD